MVTVWIWKPWTCLPHFEETIQKTWDKIIICKKNNQVTLSLSICFHFLWLMPSLKGVGWAAKKIYNYTLKSKLMSTCIHSFLIPTINHKLNAACDEKSRKLTTLSTNRSTTNTNSTINFMYFEKQRSLWRTCKLCHALKNVQPGLWLHFQLVEEKAELFSTNQRAQ